MDCGWASPVSKPPATTVGMSHRQPPFPVGSPSPPPHNQPVGEATSFLPCRAGHSDLVKRSASVLSLSGREVVVSPPEPLNLKILSRSTAPDTSGLLAVCALGDVAPKPGPAQKYTAACGTFSSHWVSGVVAAGHSDLVKQLVLPSGGAQFFDSYQSQLRHQLDLLRTGRTESLPVSNTHSILTHIAFNTHSIFKAPVLHTIPSFLTCTP